MPRSNKKTKAIVRRPWAKEDLMTLKRLAKEGAPGTRIAKVLKRTAGAVYQQAALKRVKLAGKSRPMK